MKIDSLKTQLSRRRFLSYSALATGGLLITACGGGDDDDTDDGSADDETTSQSGASEEEPTSTPEPESEAGGEETEAETSPTEPAEEDGTAPGGTLIYAESGAFNDFNPWTVSAVNMSVYNQVFSRLIWKTGDGEEMPDLAESWEMSDDGLTFTVRLREGAYWHDGTEFVADDYVTMFEYTQDEELLENANIQKHAGLIEPISNVVAVDQYTIEFQFDNPVPYITDILDYWFAIRIDDPDDTSFVDSVPVGTGPFVMDEWTPNQQVDFSKHEDYHKEDLPHLDNLVIRRLERAETLIPNLQSGEVDGIQITSLGDVGPLQEDENYQVVINENAGSYFNIIVNLQKPPFDQPEVRRALSYSLNRRQLVDSAFFGVSTPITSPFFLEASLAYREDLVMAHEFDLDMAAQLLEEAGVSDLSLTTNVTPRWPQMELFMLAWQQDLQEIGIELTVNEVETAQFYEIGGAPDLLDFDIHPWLNARVSRDPAIFWSTQSNYRGDPEVNTFGYENEEMEELIAEGASETDEEARREIYQRLNEIVVDSCHMIQVATDPRVWGFSADVNNVTFDLNGNVRFEETTVQQ